MEDMERIRSEPAQNTADALELVREDAFSEERRNWWF